ncbi:MAG: 5-formyltetrahydrofolate cyclo-ligase, partial [Gammaproteobacteria bacterium]|nr:5-formyltetrahydrofolate cyclo-ligase [Gammaproteobacteria bacterium]
LPSLIVTSKATIRKEIRARRQSLSETERRFAAAGVLQQLRKISCFRIANKVSVYLANDGELPLELVVDFLWTRNKRVFLPVLFGRKSRLMHFARFAKDSRFKLNRFGILEPDLPIRRQLKPQNMDVILMPLVAFDRAGNRLGMGGGFYDKTFAYLRNRRRWYKPHLIGIAYDLQEVNSLPGDKWDVPPDYIVTESKTIKVSKR